MSAGASAVDENKTVFSVPFIAILLEQDMLLMETGAKADASAIAPAKATTRTQATNMAVDYFD